MLQWRAKTNFDDSLDVFAAHGVGGTVGALLTGVFAQKALNGVPMSLRAAREIEKQHGWKVRVVDLRWLQPLNAEAIARHAGDCARILVVDEGRKSAGVGEGVITAIVEGGHGAKPLRRVVGVDTFTPLAGAAFLVLPGEADIVAAAAALSQGA
jgi:2-oxoisovalerate dehydrogenase E1 component